MAENGKSHGLARRPIFPELEEMRGDVRDMFRDFWDMRWPLTAWRPRWPGKREPAVDVFEREGSVVIKAEMPGIEPDKIEVTISDGQLRISGERKEETEVKEENYYRSERSYGRIFRSLPLPEGCDTEAVKATVTHGVLEVVIPKVKQAVAKKVEIKSGA